MPPINKKAFSETDMISKFIMPAIEKASGDDTA
jgi:type I restriction enzyme R subunit